MNVLVIPEDFVKDQYVLRPIIDAMLKYLDKSKSIVLLEERIRTWMQTSKK